jgi:glycosyltransferase involved in cell wall biosynthesis
MLCAGILNLRVGFEAQLDLLTTAPVTEVIRHGESGLLVDFFSSEELVNAVCGVLEHPDQMLELRQQARQTVVEQFDLRTICLLRQIELIETLDR